ncbi:MAG: TonB-dependent receptor [Tannerellaceae bacterium]|nr:TonB-dependent receptor [Tannerellaceae bacterium]
MKFISVFILFSIIQVTASTYAQQYRVSVSVKNGSLYDIVSQIEEQSEFMFFYKSEEIDSNRKVNLQAHQKLVPEILDQIAKEQNISYRIVDKHIILTPHNGVPQQTRKISGVVIDNYGDPVIGANVVVKGTTQGTITDMDGNFSLEVPANAVLIISYIGYSDKEIPVGNQSIIQVGLSENTMDLDEVVVVGYGTIKKSDLTGSLTSLKADAITLGLAQSPDMALKGKSAGVQITTVSGQPGAGAVVRVRGTSSILGSNEPLYVVDGVPLDGGGAAGGLQGESISPLTIINPSDIESMEILKDASATAIYGSRGANGVIMITTKRGKEGAFQANFNMSVGFQSVENRLKLTSPEQWAELWNESMDYKNNGTGKYDLNHLPARTNWQDEIFRTAPVQSYEISFSGGTEKLRYMLSGGYTSQDGIIMNTDFKRYTMRANVENQLSRLLTVGVNMSATRTDSNQAGHNDGENGLGNKLDSNTMIGLISLASPVVPIFAEDGSYTPYVDVESRRANPYASLKEITNNDLRNRFISNIYAEISFLKELKFKTTFATDASNATAKHYTPSYIAEGNADKGRAILGSYNRLYWNSTNTLTYINTFDKIHSLNAMVGAEWQKDVTETFQTTGTGFANDNSTFNNLKEATNFSAASGYSAWQMRSYLTRINYSLMNKYSVTFTGRIDGSSRFGANNKNAFFPSGAFAWRVMEEDFMKDFRKLSNLKLRTSYGTSGEQGIPLYQTLSTLEARQVYIGKDLYTGYYPNRSADPDLKWEKTRQVDIGLDMGFFDNRLNATIDYYYKRTNDLLYQRALPASSGFVSRLENIGTIDNKGLEITIDAYIIDNKNFKWNLNINNSINRNKIISLGDGRTEIINPSGGITAGDIQSQPSILKVGSPLGLIYGYKSDGVIYDETESATAREMGQVQYAPGELKIVDMNGDGKITDADKTIIGDANPDFTGGMTNSFTYKGFQLDILCQWVVGNDIFSMQHLMNQRMVLGYNAAQDWYDNRWQVNHPSRTEPRSGYDVRAYTDVSYHVFDGSFFRINNISLSYTFPKQILNRIKVNNLRLRASVDNVYTFTKYPGWSPDVSSMGSSVMAQGIDAATYPVPRTVSFGVNIGF